MDVVVVGRRRRSCEDRKRSGLQNGLFPVFFEALFACLAHVLRLRGPSGFKDTIWYDLCVGSTGYHFV